MNRKYLIALLPTLITFIVYLPALENGFVNWDDDLYVYANHDIRSISPVFFKWSFTAVVASLWHPLTLFSLGLDYAIWGINPFGYHLTNNIFHAINTGIVFLLAINLIKYGSDLDISLHVTKYKGESYLLKDKNIFTAAFVTAFLFGIHPLHVESVAWISERKDVLCAFFFLAALLTYLKYTSADTKRRRVGYYAFCLILFIMALMSKPMAVSLPFVLLILDFYPFKRLSVEKKLKYVHWIFLEKIPFFLLSIASSIITLFAHSTSGALKGIEIYSLKMRVFNAILAYMVYIIKMVFPFNLAPFYPTSNLHLEYISFFTIKYVWSCIILSLITIFFIWLSKKNKLFLTIWLYYIITLLPVIGIVKVGEQSMADRYSYLPSLGLYILIGLGIGNLFERYSKNRYRHLATSIALFFIFGMLLHKTVKQISIWHDSITLWSYEVKLFPNAAIAYLNRGLAYDGLGKHDQAIRDYNKCIELDQNFAKAYSNRGIIYSRLGDYWSAIKDFDNALMRDPLYENAYFNRGLTYVYLDDYDQAIKDYNMAIKLNPQNPKNYNNRGKINFMLGNYQDAIADYNIAIKLNPQDARIYFNLGLVYSQVGNVEQAIINYNKAANLGSKEAEDYLRVERRGN